jgi:hypothetical protein
MNCTEFLLNIGTLSINKPALISYQHNEPLAFLHNASTQHQASDLCEGVALQLLKQHVCGQARLNLYEVTPGRLFSQIKRLYAKTDKTWGQAFHNLKDFGQHLTDLHTQAHHRYSLLTATDSHDIYSYNSAARKKEPVIYLLITSLRPLAAEARYMNLLDDLCRQGPAVGIVPLLLRPVEDEQDIGQHDAPAKALRHFWDAQYEGTTGLELNNGVTLHRQSPDLSRLFKKFGVSYGVAPEQCRNWCDELIEATQKTASTETHQDFLSVPIGHCGATQAFFSMGDSSQAYHALIGGANGTGKTTLLNNVIINACEAFTPDQLKLWLFDFKEGISFSIYEDLPHCDVLHTDSENRGYALDAFSAFLGLIRIRSDLFKEARVTTLSAYNQSGRSPLPRCLMIVDEAQSLFDDRATRADAKRLIREISRKGRAFGLHIVLSTQSYRNVDLDDDAKAQFRLRIGFQLSSSMECRALMGRDNEAPMRLQRYAAVYNNNFGEVQDNRILHLDPLGDEDLFRRVQALRSRYPMAKRTDIKFASRQSADTSANASTCAAETPSWFRKD